MHLLLIKAPNFIYISTIWFLWQNICKNGMVLNAKKTENIEWKQTNV